MSKVKAKPVVVAVGRMRFGAAFMFNPQGEHSTYVKGVQGPWQKCHDGLTTAKRYFRQAAMLREHQR